MEGIADAHLDAFLKQLGGEILPSGGDEDEESDASEELAPAKPGGGVLTKPGRGRPKGHAGHVYSEIVLHHAVNLAAAKKWSRAQDFVMKAKGNNAYGTVWVCSTHTDCPFEIKGFKDGMGGIMLRQVEGT